ncbi:MAG: hypothetical protein J07HX5_00317 [halophilic archaeon J07HX5]|nr:MAG: hypothetical protein J07HX5_00317 [halophilic archaeon J07HX5]
MVLLVFRLESKNTDGQTLCRRYEDGSREPEFVTTETEIAVGFSDPQTASQRQELLLVNPEALASAGPLLVYECR